MAQSESILKIAPALVKAQFALGAAKKTASNPHLRSKYASLADTWEAIRAPLFEHELCVLQPTEDVESGIRVRTIILHSSGEWIDSILTIPANKQDAQGYGSALSYARRYALQSLLGVVTEDEDDDGHQASQGRPQPPRVEGRQTRQSAPVPQQRRQPVTERVPSPNRPGMLARIETLTRQATQLDLEVTLRKPLDQMTNEELIAHGKALSAAIDLAEGGSPQ